MSAETGRQVVGTGSRGEVVVISRVDAQGRSEHEVRHGGISQGTFSTEKDARATATALVKGS